ncbi:hypothetical protein OSTOST_01186 [Ostertagia ostertagi]
MIGWIRPEKSALHCLCVDLSARKAAQHFDRAPAAADEAVKSAMPDEEQQKNLQQQQQNIVSIPKYTPNAPPPQERTVVKSKDVFC